MKTGPTHHIHGTEAKIKIMAARVAKGLSPFHENDSRIQGVPPDLRQTPRLIPMLASNWDTDDPTAYDDEEN